MIYLLLILDIIINNFSKYNSYFFIIFLYNKRYKDYLLTGLILDILIFDKFLINTIILSVIYIFNKIFKELNKKNKYNYIFINIFNYILYIILSNIVLLNSFYNIFLQIGQNLIINIIFYILSYRLKYVVKNSILW